MTGYKLSLPRLKSLQKLSKTIISFRNQVDIEIGR
jgi:hypothetical protein